MQKRRSFKKYAGMRKTFHKYPNWVNAMAASIGDRVKIMRADRSPSKRVYEVLSVNYEGDYMYLSCVSPDGKVWNIKPEHKVVIVNRKFQW